MNKARRIELEKRTRQRIKKLSKELREALELLEWLEAQNR